MNLFGHHPLSAKNKKSKFKEKKKLNVEDCSGQD